MRLLYTLLLYLTLPLVLLRLLWKSREIPGYRQRIGERFGFVPPVDGGIAVWVHAVSVGETLAAQPLINALVERHGPGRVWFTTTTPTGSARAQAAFGERVRHSYAPYDLPESVARFLGRVRPQQLVVMETELWPNLFRACARRGIPLTVANARLSPRSFRGYARVRDAIAKVLADCAHIAAQSKADARRFRTLGAPHDKVGVMGNLKFDLSVPEKQVQTGKQMRAWLGAERPVWIAASTHEGEEEAALAAHRALLEVFTDAVLILVPRHPQRFDGVWQRAVDSDLRTERRSRTAFESASFESTSGGAPADRPQVLLGDSMGEMFVYLAAADVAFVGGSLVHVGGHNVLEPAALGLPVLFGPHMFNFAHARALLLERHAGIEVADATALGVQVATLLTDPALRAQMGRAGEAAIAGNRGALHRLLKLLETHPAG